MSFQKVRNVRLYEGIINQIRDLIDNGEIKPGDKFPSERELMQKLGVSRAVLREAFRVLEFRGLVESRPGDGRYLRRVKGFELHSLSSLALDKDALMDVVEAREILEVKVAKLAAQRGTEREMESLLALDDEFHGSKSDLTEYREKDKDLEFHMALAEMSHNFMLKAMANFMLNLTRDLREKAILDYNDWLSLCEQHSDIVRCVVARDAEGAGDKMKIHIESLRRGILKRK